MSASGSSGELGDFLKARRAELTPRALGWPDAGAPRRVLGLRREEVAQLASISVDYYTRLEQGRVRASASVLATLARALRLDDDQQTYLYALAGSIPVGRPRRPAAQNVRPALQRLLDQLIETPALVLDRHLDVLAWNPLAAALYTDFGRLPAKERNYVRLLFGDPTMRRLHVDWDEAAGAVVASLRMEAARDYGDPALALLVGELSVRHEDFRTRWASHHATTASSGTKHYRHAIVGDLTLECDMWDTPDGRDQRLMVLTAEAGTASHEALRILASWSATAPSSRGAEPTT